MTDLAEWLLARIAEDEDVARAAILPQYGQNGEWLTFDDKEHLSRTTVFARNWDDKLGQACETEMSWIGRGARDHIARWDPARVLAECEAKRRLIALGEKDSYWDDVLRILALPYADHPDYREEWRP